MEDRYLCKARPIGTRKQWVTGFYAVLGEKTEIIVNEPEKFYDVDSGKNSHGNKIVEVIPKTVCRCTGLKDKSGNLIWENDIIECKDGKHNFQTQIEWDAYCAGFIFKDTETSAVGLDAITANGLYSESKVVGNIFDNQELLEV